MNQYNDILPYKYNIVNPDKNGKEEININNYINASFITNPLNNKQKIIIATQTPLKDTINSFWKMIYNNKIKLIIMLSDNSKNEEKNMKLYFPKEKGNILEINNSENSKIKIELIHQEDISPDCAELKIFKIKLIIMISDTKKEEENINDINNINKSYFPQEKGNIRNIDISNESKIKIELIHKEEIAPQIAFLKIFKINDEYELKHIQITSWGNKGLPGEIFITNMLKEAEKE